MADARVAEAYDRVAGGLKAWRNQQAGVERTDRYMVLTNRSIAYLAASWPASREALLAVPGVGPAKVRDYGYVLARFFRELRAGGEPEMPLLVSSPVPEGLAEEDVELLFAVRTLEGSLESMARRRGWAVDALVERLVGLVEAGCVDVVHILCSPLEIHLVAEHVRAHPDADRAALAAALPSTSALARVLVPVAVRVQAADDVAPSEAS